ncbi:MAG: IreB family regulatory phosphoprotein [Ruminococcaceae bacterium]|nr:IreB family regulatory phosphoprotein [Oscillospiraceae bacterium]
MDANNTMKFSVGNEKERQVKEILSIVYGALVEKGYNPISQMVGYIMSGDPTYITSHNSARKLIGRLERDEILDELVKEYVKNL